MKIIIEKEEGSLKSAMTSKNQKRIFIIISIVFVILLLYASYDISTKTTFPGSKPQLIERVGDQFHETEGKEEKSDKADSLTDSRQKVTY